MKVLMTIAEYQERAINLVVEYAKQIINETADDYFRKVVIEMLATKCFTNKHFVKTLYVFRTFLIIRSSETTKNIQL